MKTVVIQAAIVTFWDAVLCGSMALSGGSSSSMAYLTAIGLTVVIYLVGYVLFSLGYLDLAFTKRDLARSFHKFRAVPVKAVVALVGLFVTAATLVISFFPSSELSRRGERGVRDHPRGEFRGVGGHPARDIRAAASRRQGVVADSGSR